MATRTKAKSATPEIRAIPVPPGVDGFLRKSQVAAMLSVSPSTFKAMRSKGEYPAPDTHMGVMPVWSIATHNEYVRARVAKGKGG